MTIRFFDPKNEINFVRFFKPMLMVAALIPVIAIVGGSLGINWGIDFQGGTEVRVRFEKEPSSDEINDVLSKAGFEKHQVQRIGTAQSIERLIRVERLETFTDEDIKRIEKLIQEAFPASGENVAQVVFNSEKSDRLVVLLPEPKVSDEAKEAEGASASTALSAQRASLAYLLDTKSGFRLRQVKDLDGQMSTLNSVKPDEPKNDMVSYNVMFTGPSDKIRTTLSEKFGEIEPICTTDSKSCVLGVSFVDSNVSQQLRNEGALAVLFALLAILIYIAIRFDFFFAPGAIVALIQDTFGAFLVFVFFQYEFDLPSVAALLTVLGVSINNTIVVYDRIRETVPPPGKREADDEHVTKAVNRAINDTLSRTINTTLTVVIAAVALWWFAGGVIESFAMVLIVGLSLGALSGTFAAPATYLFMRRRFGHLGEVSSETERGRSREEKARGVV